MNISYLKLKFLRHPLIDSLLHLQGNAKACVWTEPLWGVPYNLYQPFAAVYMNALGLNDVQIGLIISVGMFFQVIASLLGGLLVDKYGRRMITAVVDFIGWTIPCLIWAFAQNFWWFVAAAAFNSAWQITNTSWTCLLVEDAEKSKMVHIYTLISISGRLSVLFAPFSAFFMQRYALVPTMRVLYMFAAVCMSAKFIILYFYSTETKLGLVRMEATGNISFADMLIGYKDVLRDMAKDRQTIRILGLVVALSIMQAVLDNFFALYVTQNLGLPEGYLAYFPILRAAVMLFFFFAMQKRLENQPLRPPLIAALGLYIFCHVLLIAASWTSGGAVFALVIIFLLCESFAFALVIPRKDSLLALNITAMERSRCMSLIAVIMLAFSTPFGALAGYLSQMDRRLPLALNIFLFLFMAAMVIGLQETTSTKSGDESDLYD